jgi:hypothetical protein
VDARAEIEALVGFQGRLPGTDAERRAARHLERRLSGLGRGVEVEPIDVWPAWHLTHAIHAALAIVGSLLSVSSPRLGGALVLVAVVLTFGDASGMFLIARRLTGRRASQNVISREDGGKPGTLILVAHYDAARTGVVFGRGLQERLAALGRRVRRPIGPFEPFLWSMLLLLACCAVRVSGVEGLALNVVQFVPTVILLLSIPAFVDVALPGAAPGANDNASGAATVLRLAERYGGELERFDLWVLLTGSEEAFALGMRAFLKRHRKELARGRTVILNVDEVGAGTVRYTRREGLVLAARSHVQLVALCDQIAEDDEGYFGARGLVSRTVSDGAAARAAGFSAITVGCRNALDYVPHHHQSTDTPDRVEDEALERAFGFCSELVERLDAQIGPALAVPDETAPAPAKRRS